jgi:PAS domain S-box-containing protein
MRTPQGIAARIAAVYALLACLWILVSGFLTIRLPQPLGGMVEIGKGILFVFVTSLLLYVVIGRWTQAAAGEARRAAQAERELQRVVDTAPVGMLLLDAAGDVTFVNPAAEQLLGVTADQCVGHPLAALCGTEPLAVSVSELLATGSIDGLELPIPSGGTRPVIARAARLDRASRTGGWVVALADNSNAQEQTDRFKRLVSGYRLISAMAAVVGRARDSAQLFAQLCSLAVDVGGFKAAWAVVRDESGGGYTTAGIVGLGTIGARVAEDMRSAQADSSSAFQARLIGTDVLIRNDVHAEEGSVWSEAADESGFESYAAFAVVENGVMTAAVALFAEEPGYFGVEERQLLATLKADLTYALERLTLEGRRAEAEEALARSEEGYRQLFDAYPQPMWVYDKASLRFLAMNDAAVAKYGFSRKEFAEMSIKDVRPATEIPQLMEHVARKPTTGLVDAGYWTHHDAHGRQFPVHVMTHRIAWDGQEAELVMIQEVAHM